MGVIREKPYLLAEDFTCRYAARIAVARRSDSSVAGYLLKTDTGWRIEAAHPSLVDGAIDAEHDPADRLYQNPDDAAVPLYMRGRAYRKSYRASDDPSGALEIFVTLIAGLWAASVCERSHPYKMVVPTVSSPSLEEAKYSVLLKAHHILFNQDEDPGGQLRSFAKEEWDDVPSADLIPAPKDTRPL